MRKIIHGNDHLKVCIYRVPRYLIRAAYVPRMVALGPYHFKRTQPMEMDYLKLEAARRMQTRLNVPDLDFVVAEIQNSEDAIKSCYDEATDRYSGEIFAWMITLDACFILEVLRALGAENEHLPNGYNFEPVYDPDRILFVKPEILTDILLLENQIPLFVLTMLLNFELQQIESSQLDAKRYLFSMIVKSQKIFENFYPFSGEDNDLIDAFSSVERTERHLLELFRSLIVPDAERSEPSSGVVQKPGTRFMSCYEAIMHRRLKNKHYSDLDASATELHAAGIQFKSYEGGPDKIRFDKDSNTIFLPKIKTTYHTEIYFRNLMAFEVCDPNVLSKELSCYTILMDELIKSHKDVALLRREGILVNFTGSDKDIADLFSSLCKEIPRNYYNLRFVKFRKDVNEYYRSKFNVMVAQFLQEKCSKPWQTVSLVAAIVLLLLTTVQTIFSIRRRLFDA